MRDITLPTFRFRYSEIETYMYSKRGKFNISISISNGSLGFAPTFKIGFVVTGREIYLYCIHQGNKSDKERKNGKKKFYAYKKI